MNQTHHFFNLGYGWLCKHCSAEDAEKNRHRQGSQLFTEGQAENKKDKQSTLALARWADSTCRSLTCPRCDTEEMIGAP